MTQRTRSQHVHQLMPRPKFIAKVVRNIVLGILLICFALIIGMMGYHRYENMSWVDSFVNAAMILSGMGPMGSLNTYAGKVFAGCYALFSGLFFILIVGLIFGPIAHRLFKIWHIQDEAPNP